MESKGIAFIGGLHGSVSAIGPEKKNDLRSVHYTCKILFIIQDTVLLILLVLRNCDRVNG